MGRQASDRTLLLQCRSQLRRVVEDLNSIKTQRDTYQVQLVARVREVEEWKRRFDALLKIMPEKPNE